MDTARRTATALMSAGVVLSLGAACGPTTSAPHPTSADARNAVDRSVVEAPRAAKPADTGTPPAKRLATVGFVVDNGFLTQSIGQRTTSKATGKGRYKLVVKGLNPKCRTTKPKVALLAEGMAGKATASVSTACATGDVTINVRRTQFGGKRVDAAFYFAVFRGVGPKPAGVANPQGRRVAVGQVSKVGKVSKVQSSHGVHGDRYGKGQFDVTVKRLDKGCSNNAPLMLVHVLRGGVPVAMGAGVDCQSGHTNLPFNIYSGSGAKKNAAFTFTVYRGQPISETTRPTARCRLAVDAPAGCG